MIAKGLLLFVVTDRCTTIAMDYAAERGHLEIFKFLHENRAEGCTPEAMDVAAANGHFEVVKFLLKTDLKNARLLQRVLPYDLDTLKYSSIFTKTWMMR